jgi:hypothetical protein
VGAREHGRPEGRRPARRRGKKFGEGTLCSVYYLPLCELRPEWLLFNYDPSYHTHAGALAGLRETYASCEKESAGRTCTPRRWCPWCSSPSTDSKQQTTLNRGDNGEADPDEAGRSSSGKGDRVEPRRSADERVRRPDRRSALKPLYQSTPYVTFISSKAPSYAKLAGLIQDLQDSDPVLVMPEPHKAILPAAVPLLPRPLQGALQRGRQHRLHPPHDL